MIGRVNIDKSQNSQNFQNTINCIQIGRQLLLHHSEIRPITSTDLNFFESSIRISTHIWDAEVRDAVCSQLLLLKALGIGKRLGFFEFYCYFIIQKKTSKLL